MTTKLYWIRDLYADGRTSVYGPYSSDQWAREEAKRPVYEKVQERLLLETDVISVPLDAPQPAS